MGVAVGRRRVGGRTAYHILAAVVALLIAASGPTRLWAHDIEVIPETDSSKADQKDADAKTIRDDFQHALKDAADKSPAFKALLAKIKADDSVTVSIHVRKDVSGWIDSALKWNTAGVTDLNLTNLLRFPNPGPDPKLDAAKQLAIKMQPGFPDWAVSRTEILYHILDEAYLGALAAKQQKLVRPVRTKGMSDEKWLQVWSDYKKSVSNILSSTHATAVIDQRGVRKDFGQTMAKVYRQSDSEDGEALDDVVLGGKSRSPEVKMTFLAKSDHIDELKVEYLWFDDGLLKFGFFTGVSHPIGEPVVPPGGYAMADTPEAPDQPQYADRDNLGTPQVAAEDSDGDGMTPLESAVLADINEARTHPADYARQLAASGPQIAVTREAIAYLQALQPLAPLAANIRLIHSAQKDAADEGSHGLTDHIGSDGSTATQRMQREGVFASVFEEEISFGKRTAEAVVRQLVIDPDNPRRAHRADLFDPLVRLAGVGCGPHATEGAMCVIDITSAMLGD